MYWNVRLAVPLPETYPASTRSPPICSSTLGVPADVLTTVFSDSVTVTITVSPPFRMPFCAPIALVSAMSLTVGGVSRRCC